MLTAGKELYQQGLACEKDKDISGAFEAFRLSAKANPQVAAPYVGLSRLLMANHQRSQAISCLQRAVACESANPAMHILLARALSEDGQIERARQGFEQALRLDSNADDALIGLARLFEDLGERSESARHYQALLERSPANAQALAGLLAVAKEEDLDKAIQLAYAQLDLATDSDTASIAYALGKVLARRDEHQAAFKVWEKANSARQKIAGAFDRGHFDRRIEELIKLFSADFFTARRAWGEQSDIPVFIVGLPRSGTTLSEQILASHPGVFGAGELDLLTDLATGTPDRLGRADPPWPQSAPELSREIVDTIAREHLKRLSALAPANTLRIIDKQPLNFWHIGLLALTLPNARIIQCSRDIRDNGISIFAEDFTAEQRWSTKLSDIAYYWHGYHRLMTHWKEVTGLQIVNVNYEEIIGDLEGQARRLTDFLGLPWDPAVLDFHEAERAVQTPSRWQVRQPLYSSSSGRWRLYKDHIRPLIAAAEASS